MNSEDFEGSIILEKLAEIGKVEEFFDLIDSDDFEGAIKLMKRANIDRETIALAVAKMKAADGEH